MRAFIRRVVDAITGEPESLDARRERERRKDAAKQERKPESCDVCCVEGHDRDACPSAIGPGDVGRTWQSGDFPDRFPGQGDTFEKVRAFFQRFRGEG